MTRLVFTLIAGCGGVYESSVVSLGHEPPSCDVAAARSVVAVSDEITCRFEDAPQVEGVRVGLGYYGASAGTVISEQHSRNTRGSLRGIVTFPPTHRAGSYVCRVWQQDPPYEPAVWWKRLCESEPFTVSEE